MLGSDQRRHIARSHVERHPQQRGVRQANKRIEAGSPTSLRDGETFLDSFNDQAARWHFFLILRGAYINVSDIACAHASHRVHSLRNRLGHSLLNTPWVPLA